MADARWAADERKLQAAYDDLSVGRTKAAEPLLKQWLKKHPKSQPAMVLRMYLLERQSESETSILQVYEAVKATGEFSTRSAWWLGQCFKNLGRADLTLALFQDLWATNPGRKDFAEHVFLQAVVAWDEEVMVASSRKSFNKDKTAAWAREAAWAEWVTKAPQPTSEHSFPPPAEAGVLKTATTLLVMIGKQSASADILWLRLQILISAGELEQAWNVLEAEAHLEHGSLTREWWKMRAAEVVLKRMEEKGEDVSLKWEAEWTEIVNQLRVNSTARRNYAFFRHLVLCTLHVLTRTRETLELLLELESEMGASKERAPALAALDLDLQVRRTGDRYVFSEEEWLERVKWYWEDWGAKGSFLSEIGGVLGSDDRISKVSDILQASLGGITISDETTYRRHANAELWLLRYQPSDWVPEQQDIRRAWALYLDGLQFGRNLPKTDVQPADEMGLATSQLLLIRWHKNPRDETSLFAVVACLRYITFKSPSCMQAHVLLIRLFRTLGAFGLADSHISTLAPDEVQLDTLLHFATDRSSFERIGSTSDPGWVKYAMKAGAMYNRAHIDLPEHLKQCLQHESYSTIHGIRETGQRLRKSLAYAILRMDVDGLRGDAMFEGRDLAKRSLQEVLADKDDIRDNRDFELLPEIGGKRKSTREMIALGTEVNWGWLAAFATAWLRILRCGTGEDGEANPIELADSLLPSEKAYLRTLQELARIAERDAKVGTSSSGSIVNEIDVTLQELIDENVQCCLSTKTTSRWEILYSCSWLFELETAVNLISPVYPRKAASTGGKKNKKKATATVSKLDESMTAVRVYVGTRIPVVLEMLDGLKARDENIKWEAVADVCMSGEKQFALDFGKEITTERRIILDRWHKVLKERF